MLPIATGLQVFLAAGATDLRKGFDGLAALVESVIEQDPLSGHVFAFCNRSRNRVKLLLWDGSGLWVMAKRLEQGTFAWPRSDEQRQVVTLSQEELTALLAGLDLSLAQHRQWWRRAPRRQAVTEDLPT